jgi:DNA segregation ATPase FtsK/SpoIIIE-like protein
MDVQDELNNDIELLIKKLITELKNKKFVLQKIVKLFENRANVSIKVLFKNILEELKDLVIIEIKESSNRITYIIYSFIPVKELWKELEQIEKCLKVTIKDIQQEGKKIYSIQTTKIPWKKYIRNHLNSDKDRVFYTLKRSGYNLTNLDVKSNKYQDCYNFDCNAEPKEIYGSVEYIKHITKVDFSINSSKYKDYELIIKKPAGVIDFFTLFKNVNLDTKNNILLGYDEKGKEIIISIFDLYHSIVAGTTGFGKSNLGHVVISSLLKSPLDIVNVLLDPKKSEAKRYRDIDNVFYSGDNSQIVNVLKYLEKEMDRRNKLFEQDKFIRDIETWNKKYPHDQLPYIVIYIEEIADLIKSSDKRLQATFSDTITRLTQLGRSTGFRVFLSTQSPKRDIIKTIIKANCATKFGFGVTNVSESMVILDNNNAKGLEIGEMILQMNGKETKVKVPLLEDNDIENIINYLEDLSIYSKKPMAKKFVSFMSNELLNSVLTVSETVSRDTDDTKKEINDSDELLELYKRISPDINKEILSISKTLPYITIGRTKLQKFRSELVDKNYFINSNKKLYWNTENKLKLVK